MIVRRVFRRDILAAVLTAVCLVAGCAGCRQVGQDDRGRGAFVGPPAPVPAVSNPTVTAGGTTYYLNGRRDPALPGYLRVACYDIHRLDPPHAMLLLRGDDVLQAVPMAGAFGYLGDVTGNGVDEVIVMSQPMATGLRVRPFNPTVRLDFIGETPPRLLDIGDAAATELMVYRQGERLERIFEQRPDAGRRVTIGKGWGRTQSRDKNGYAIATTDGRRRQWADLYGDGRPVWCEVNGKLATLTIRGGTTFHRLDMTLEAYWRYDRAAGKLTRVPFGQSVFSPTGEQLFLGKLRGVLARQAVEAPSTAP
ncbi:MAG: hypothetical protein GVY16_09635 [Planctomycetes bacterium]|jgi:hypothetical protein|nr:hypothetical protein [Phycisphaerae bacterium]NBB95982.1 hypothetical protein [Planctomycetota bacterium]